MSLKTGDNDLTLSILDEGIKIFGSKMFYKKVEPVLQKKYLLSKFLFYKSLELTHIYMLNIFVSVK